MSDQYIGEIRQVGFNFVPEGWLPCDGSVVPIQNYDTLFVLLGTTYGGDGQTTFGLPDLRGRTPLGAGAGPGLSNYSLGQMGGLETVTLTTTQLPVHGHSIPAQTAQPATTSLAPTGSAFGNSNGQDRYATPGSLVSTSPVLQPVGGGLAHENRMPYVATMFCIAYTGIFPSQS